LGTPSSRQIYRAPLEPHRQRGAGPDWSNHGKYSTHIHCHVGLHVGRGARSRGAPPPHQPNRSPRRISPRLRKSNCSSTPRRPASSQRWWPRQARKCSAPQPPYIHREEHHHLSSQSIHHHVDHDGVGRRRRWKNSQPARAHQPRARARARAPVGHGPADRPAARRRSRPRQVHVPQPGASAIHRPHRFRDGQPLCKPIDYLSPVLLGCTLSVSISGFRGIWCGRL
jgi:hypothetical protein